MSEQIRAHYDLLVVEDNPGDVRLIRELLTESPTQLGDLDVAETAHAALDRIAARQRPYDAILLDLRLPDSAGETTVHTVAEAAPASPIVVLTGDTDARVALRSLHEGAEDFLVKGEHDADGLWRAIRYAAERHAAGRRIGELNRLLRVVGEVNQLIVRETDRDRLLHQATEILVGHGGYRCAWLGVPSPEDGWVGMVAPAGVPAADLTRLEESCQRDPSDPGPTCRAIAEGETVTVADTSAPDASRRFAAAAVTAGIGAVVSVPLSSHGRSLGALTVGAAPDGGFDSEEIALFEELAADLGFALDAMDVEDRRRETERELRRERDFGTAVLDTAGALVVVLDRDGRIVRFNRACEELTGRTEREVRRKRVWELFVPAGEREPVAEIFAELIATGAPSTAEKPWLDRDGNLRFVEWRNTCLTGDDGEVEFVIGTGVDVTERRRFEEQLARRARIDAAIAALYRPLASPSPSIEEVSTTVLEEARRLTTSAHGYVSEVDPETRANVGHTLTRMMDDCPVADEHRRIVFPPDPDGTYPRLWGHALTTREPFFTNRPGEHPASGGVPAGHMPLGGFLTVPVLLGDELVGQIALANPDRPYTEDDLDAVGRIAEFYALAIQRLRADRAVTLSERRYRGLFERNLAGVYRSTVEGGLLDCNPAFADMFGFADRGAALAQTAYELYFERAVRDRFVAALREHGEVQNWEQEMRRADGATLVALLNAALVEDAAGERRIIEGTIVDLSEHVRLQEQLQHAQRMEALGRLAGGAAHDFNNLLQAIAGLQRGLAAARDDETAFADRAAELDGLIERGAQLSRQLLIFSRREQLRCEAVDVAATVSDAVRLVRHLLRENIEIGTELTERRLSITGDRGQLEQVVVNLAVNAQDAMPDGGRLDLRVGDDRGRAVVEVADTGHGIPPEIVDRVFEPFFTTKAADRGTGLGLAVVQDIITGMDGDVTVDSEPGVGTTFRITLPLRAPEEDRMSPPPTAVPGGETAPSDVARILLVEDESAVRAGLVDLIHALGHDVDAVASTAEARDAASDASYDLLLTDLQLTDGSGLDLAGDLADRCPGLAVVLMSGYTAEAALGGDDGHDVRFLEKPFGLKRLGDEIAAALASRSGDA